MPSAPIEPLSRRQLASVLGLGPGVSRSEMLRAGEALLQKLERRLAVEGDAVGAWEDATPLELEIDRLRASLEPLRPDARSWFGARSREWTAREQALLGTSFALALFSLFLIADRVGFFTTDSRVASVAPAALIVESRPEGAELRISDPETEELLLRLPATAARIQLEAGRYALELSRADCPDVWRRSIQLEPEETRRFEAEVCTGAGELVVRSNVSGDRLRVDQLDLGSTRAEPHLLGTGDHAVRVEKAGFAPFEGKVRIRPGERVELRVELVATGGDPGSTSPSPKAASGTRAKPLPFDIVPPTRAPGAPNAQSAEAAARVAAASARRQQRASELAAAARVPLEKILPDPIRPQDFEPPRARFDFDDPGAGQAIAPGGSTPWLDRMTARVLRSHDTDRSGQIDMRSETDSIPCTLWRAIEGSFDEAGLGLSMARFYGFDGTEWHPRALGFAQEQRSAAYARMKACGLAS